jgi:hypothetical protein
MSGLASMILRGRAALALAANAELLGMQQDRRIVRLRGEASVGVYDATREELVVFDGAALVALALAETDEDTPWIESRSGVRVTNPPSRL